MSVIDEQIITLASNSLHLPASKLQIAIIPTAAGQEPDFYKWIDLGISYFSDFGLKAFGLPVISQKDAHNNQFVDRLNDAKIIYFSGGDPGYLLNCLRNTPFLEKIMIMYRRGAVLAASSAGAMAMGKFVLTNPYHLTESDKLPIWDRGFAITPKSIIPHYDYMVKNEPQMLKKIISYTSAAVKTTLLGIDENTALFQINDKFANIIGHGDITNF